MMLKRSPLFLRVTERDGKLDALDQLDDKPHESETIYAYERVGEAYACHINATKGGGFYSMADYKFVVPQPTDKEMRTLDAWRKCAATLDKERHGK